MEEVVVPVYKCGQCKAPVDPRIQTECPYCGYVFVGAIANLNLVEPDYPDERALHVFFASQVSAPCWQDRWDEFAHLYILLSRHRRNVQMIHTRFKLIGNLIDVPLHLENNLRYELEEIQKVLDRLAEFFHISVEKLLDLKAESFMENARGELETANWFLKNKWNYELQKAIKALTPHLSQ